MLKMVISAQKELMSHGRNKRQRAHSMTCVGCLRPQPNAQVRHNPWPRKTAEKLCQHIVADVEDMDGGPSGYDVDGLLQD